MLLLLDADFIASAGLHEFLTRDDKAADLMEDLTTNRKVIVLPAFETEASLGVEAGGQMALKAQASEHLSAFYKFLVLKSSFNIPLPGRQVWPIRHETKRSPGGRRPDGSQGVSQWGSPYVCKAPMTSVQQLRLIAWCLCDVVLLVLPKTSHCTFLPAMSSCFWRLLPQLVTS